MHGYDVFFDYQSIDSGNFESVILDNIRARAHFIVILTPSALENCKKTGDWLRREIETAMDENRNIIPLMVENFDFGSIAVKEALTGKLASLGNYNGLSIPNAYALEAMERLRERYLNKALGVIPTLGLHLDAQKITETQKVAASEAAPVQEEQLTAQTWFERGFVFDQEGKYDESIRCYTEAITLQPDFAEAYSLRGTALTEKDDLYNAIKDHNRAIRIQPNVSYLCVLRGITYGTKGRLVNAIRDFSQALKFDPSASDAHYNRGKAFELKGNLDKALKDYDKAIHLKPDYARAYCSRGSVCRNKGNLDDALADYNEAIRLKPKHASVYYNRALIGENKKNYVTAINDYQTYLELGGGIQDGDKKVVEEKIENLKNILTKKKSVKKKSK